MSRRDAARWRGARSLDDLGELVVAWLNGKIMQTPGHCAPPCTETIPLIPVLTAANRAGFITDNSQQADRDGVTGWEAWVCGFATDDVLRRLRATTAGTRLKVSACRGRSHTCRSMRVFGWRGCGWRDAVGFWSEACFPVSGQLQECWYVTVVDPVPARNEVLWPALTRFADGG